MPQLGETVTEGTVTRWMKAIGDTVARDEPLFEVSTDKVDSEVPSPAAGVLTEILVPEGETVEVGVRLAVIGDESAAAAAPADAAPAASAGCAGAGPRRLHRPAPAPPRLRPLAAPAPGAHRHPRRRHHQRHQRLLRHRCPGTSGTCGGTLNLPPRHRAAMAADRWCSLRWSASSCRTTRSVLPR